MVGLQCLVGTSFAATELLQCSATFELLHAHRRPFGFAGDRNYSIAGLRKLLSCVRRRASLNLRPATALKLAAFDGLQAPKTNAIAGFRPLLSCIRIRDRLLS